LALSSLKLISLCPPDMVAGQEHDGTNPLVQRS
jgi:hypothetical protein